MKEIMTMYIQEATLCVWHDEVEIPFKIASDREELRLYVETSRTNTDSMYFITI